MPFCGVRPASVRRIADVRRRPCFLASRRPSVTYTELDGDIASGALAEFAPDRRAVRAVAEAHEREQHEQFEFPENRRVVVLQYLSLCYIYNMPTGAAQPQIGLDRVRRHRHNRTPDAIPFILLPATLSYAKGRPHMGSASSSDAIRNITDFGLSVRNAALHARAARDRGIRLADVQRRSAARAPAEGCVPRAAPRDRARRGRSIRASPTSWRAR